MTCIVGIINKKENTVYIGGDSCSSNNSTTISSKIDKVFRNGDFIFGCTSSYRMIQLLRYKFKPNPLPESISNDCGDILLKYFVCDFIPNIKKIFNDNGFGRINENENIGGTFLIGYKDRLFKIQDDYSIEEYFDDYIAIGCGEQYASGALFALDKNYSYQSIKTRIEIALDAAAKFSPFCDNNYTIINSLK